MDTRWTVVEKSDKENSLLRRTLAEELGDKKDNGRKKGKREGGKRKWNIRQRERYKRQSEQ